MNACSVPVTLRGMGVGVAVKKVPGATLSRVTWASRALGAVFLLSSEVQNKYVC